MVFGRISYQKIIHDNFTFGLKINNQIFHKNKYLITVQNIELSPLETRNSNIIKNSLCRKIRIFFSKTPSQDIYLIDFMPSITSVESDMRLSLC